MRCETLSTRFARPFGSRDWNHGEYFSEDTCVISTRSIFGRVSFWEVLAVGITESPPGTVRADLEMIVYQRAPGDAPACVYLHEVGGVRRFCTMVSACTYLSLIGQIEQFAATRPPTHVGWVETVLAGGKIEHVLADKFSPRGGWLESKPR